MTNFETDSTTQMGQADLTTQPGQGTQTG